MINSDKFVVDNLTSTKSSMEAVWKGYASSELGSSLGQAIDEMSKVKEQIVSFDSALALLDIYKEKDALIRDYQTKIDQQMHIHNLPRSLYFAYTYIYLSLLSK